MFVFDAGNDDRLAPLEPTITLKQPTTQVIMPGTVLEATLHFYDQQLGRTVYKHSWLKRVWYTSTIGRRFWTATG
jgi:hypothetical protein